MEAAFTGFKVLGAVASGLSGYADSMSRSAQAESDALVAETQALQRDTAARDDLNRHLGSVRAARAANGLSALSPNARVLEKEARKVMDRERLINRANDRQRAQNFRTAASSYRRNAQFNLFGGLAKGAIPLGQHLMYGAT